MSAELGGALSVDIVTDMGSEALVSDTVKIGTAIESETLELDGGGVTLSAFDAAFPSPLNSFIAVLVGPGGVLTVDENNPSSTVQIEAGSYRLLTYADAGQTDGGTFAVNVEQQNISVGGGVSFIPMADSADQQISRSFELDTPKSVEVSVTDFRVSSCCAEPDDSPGWRPGIIDDADRRGRRYGGLNAGIIRSSDLCRYH